MSRGRVMLENTRRELVNVVSHGLSRRGMVLMMSVALLGVAAVDPAAAEDNGDCLYAELKRGDPGC